MIIPMSKDGYYFLNFLMSKITANKVTLQQIKKDFDVDVLYSPDDNTFNLYTSGVLVGKCFSTMKQAQQFLKDNNNGINFGD